MVCPGQDMTNQVSEHDVTVYAIRGGKAPEDGDSCTGNDQVSVSTQCHRYRQ
jgi:hypothetical protein